MLLNVVKYNCTFSFKLYFTLIYEFIPSHSIYNTTNMNYISLFYWMLDIPCKKKKKNCFCKIHSSVFHPQLDPRTVMVGFFIHVCTNTGMIQWKHINITHIHRSYTHIHTLVCKVYWKNRQFTRCFHAACQSVTFFSLKLLFEVEKKVYSSPVKSFPIQFMCVFFCTGARAESSQTE